MGSRGIALPFHDHGTRRGWGVSVTPRPLFTRGKNPVPIVQEDGWTPGPVWTGEENLAPTGIRSPDRPARSHSLYRLSYPVRIWWNTRMKSYCIWRHIIASGVSRFFGHQDCSNFFFFFSNFLFIWSSNFRLFLSLEICRPLNSAAPRRPFLSSPSPLYATDYSIQILLLLFFFCTVIPLCLFTSICLQHYNTVYSSTTCFGHHQSELQWYKRNSVLRSWPSLHLYALQYINWLLLVIYE